MNTTAKQLVEHWNWAAEKGVMNRNTASALRAACAKVLGVLDKWEDVDVTALDVEDVIRRFKNVHARDFNPSSLDAYERRFRNAVESFLEYAKDPGAWKPSNRTPRGRRNADEQTHERTRKPEPSRQTEVKKETTEPSPARGLIEYPFPLRETHVARLILPRDITVSEVKRIYAFMLALAVDNAEKA